MGRCRLFGTNWKMHMTTAQATAYALTLRNSVADIVAGGLARIFVLPPYTSIAAVKQISGDSFWVGAQNMHWEDSGPYTGEISAPMLAELGIDLVQLGHAECREMFREDDVTINRKVHAALKAGFRPLVCIGESLLDRKIGAAPETCARQLRIALREVTTDTAHRLIIAYEPVWAIGQKGAPADSGSISEMTRLLRALLVDWFGEPGENVAIVYGGSVREENAGHLFTETGIDGLFVGRAALDPHAFASLIHRCLLAGKEETIQRNRAEHPA
jgi:triosephosphate isomerase